ncbi:TetR family transcriptional regulator [Patulibacter sp. SYSU D01012]|uniref:TetR/AcrR family transcriptional regulator n=1 Tax=Patulibacter sp. SYSU D01012 TaxID=2817381 RepID=UPI001B300715|nr:TetR family transcriptional regulator [Patulibacter sp. SYSU D01012]
MTPPDLVLEAIAAELSRRPAASMQELAAAAGIGRTTLHRRFATRFDLVRAVAAHALGEADRIFDAVGLDDAPPAAALDRLADEVMGLALAYALLFADATLEADAGLAAEVERQDARLERFVARAQRDGVLRADLPARWIVFSLGAQASALWWAVRDEHLGRRQAPALFRTTVLDGLAARAAGGGS